MGPQPSHFAKFNRSVSVKLSLAVRDRGDVWKSNRIGFRASRTQDRRTGQYGLPEKSVILVMIDDKRTSDSWRGRKIPLSELKGQKPSGACSPDVP